MPGGAIEVASVSKYYLIGSNERVAVLDHVSFGVPSGQLAAVFGPNGCGKTTLLQAIAGLIPIDAGSIAIDGRPPGGGCVGYIFQDYRQSLFPWRTVEKNIGFPLEVRGVPSGERRHLVREHLESLGLDLPLETFPYMLSGGQQQLLAIARASIADPSIFVLDEPFSALDLQTRMLMQFRIQDIWERTGRTMLLVSHDLDEALLVADRVILLSRRPARILADITIPLPRPRTREMERGEVFFHLRRRALECMATSMEMQ